MLIEDNPFQTRKISEDDAVSSIKDLGLLRVALIVRPHPEKLGRYQLAFGHRTLSTLRKLGKTEVPCEIRELDDETMAKMLYQENADRKELNDFERGRFFKRYMEKFGLSTREAEKRLGVDHSVVVRCVGITGTLEVVVPTTSIDPSAFQNAITANKFKEASRLKNEEKKTQALVQVATHDFSTDETKALVTKIQRGKEPEKAANEVLLERETMKPERYQLKKNGIARVGCPLCGRNVFVKFREKEGGGHTVRVLNGEKR